MFGKAQKYNEEMIAELTRRLVEAEAKNSLYAVQIETQRALIKDLEDRVGALEYTENLEEKISDLESRIDDVESNQIDDPADEIGDLGGRVSDLEDEVREMHDLQDDLTDLRAKFEKYSQRQREIDPTDSGMAIIS